MTPFNKFQAIPPPLGFEEFFAKVEEDELVLGQKTLEIIFWGRFFCHGELVSQAARKFG